MRRRPERVLVLSMLFLCLPALSLSVGPAPGGNVEWVAGFIRGVGYGTARPSGNRVADRIQAIRAAEVSAYRALAETIQGVRVDSQTTMQDRMKEAVVASRVEGLVRGAQRVRADVSWEGDVPLATVELRVCLSADAPECRSGAPLVSVLVEDRREELPPPAAAPPGTISGSPTGESSQLPPGTATFQYDPERPVTGMLVDLSGLPFERVLLPVVVARPPAGSPPQTVYSVRNVRPEVVRTHGIVRYADNVDQARRNPRLGDNPLVVRISGVTRERQLLLGADAARVLRETTSHGNDYLSEAKVVIAGK
jgi:hypothetical protein